MRFDEMFQGESILSDVDRDIDNQINQVELMGYDLDEMLEPELMGKLFGRLISRIRKRRKGKGIIRRIVSRIKRKKRAKKAGKSRGDYGLSLTTPEGRASIGPEGITYEDRIRMMKAGMLPPQQESTGIMDTITKNPMFLAIPAGLFLMMMMKKKRPATVPAAK